MLLCTICISRTYHVHYSEQLWTGKYVILFKFIHPFSRFNFLRDVTITYILENQQRQRRFGPLPKRRGNSCSLFLHTLTEFHLTQDQTVWHDKTCSNNVVLMHRINIVVHMQYYYNLFALAIPPTIFVTTTLKRPRLYLFAPETVWEFPVQIII